MLHHRAKCVAGGQMKNTPPLYGHQSLEMTGLQRFQGFYDRIQGNVVFATVCGNGTGGTGDNKGVKENEWSNVS